MDKTLRNIIILTVVSIVLVTTITTALTNIIIEHEKNNILNTRTIRTAILANAAKEKVEQMINLLVATSNLPQVKNTKYADQITETLKGIPENSDVEKRQIAQNILASSNDYVTIRFFMPNGDMYMQEPYSSQAHLKQINFAFRDYFQGAIKTKQPYISEMFKAQSTGDETTCVAVPIYVHNSLIGVWSGLVQVHTFQNSLSNVPLEKNVSAKFFDHNGHIIYDTDTSVTNNFNYSEYKKIVEMALNGTSGNDIVDIHGVKTFIVYHTFKAGPHTWAVLLTQPYSDAFVVVKEAQTLLSVILITLLSGAVITSSMAYKMIKTKFQLINSLLQTNIDLTESKGKFKNLYDGNPDLLCTINTKGMIIDCNKTHATTLGYSKKELIGKSIFDLTADKSMETGQVSFSSFLINGQIRDNEIWIKKRDGSTFPSLISVNGVYDQNHLLVEGIVTIKDATQLNDAKMMLVEKEKQLIIKEEKSKNERLIAIGETAARLGHDLRNPLAVIKANLEVMKLLSKPGASDQISQERYDAMDESVSRMSYQIEDVLDFVRTKPLELSDNSLGEIINNVIRQIPKHDNIKINIPHDDMRITCDARKIEIVLINLITNAIQSIGDNKGEITVSITDHGEKVIVEVEDSGPGIPDNILPKIFEPLFTTKQTGTGLGLTSCKNIIEQHGSNITVKNNPTKFTITLSKVLELAKSA